MARKKWIGVFDSGFGGLDILKGIVKRLPQYNYLYLADSARSPYGSRSSKVVYDFTLEAVKFLFAHNCELVVLACNTASSDALGKIQHLWLPSLKTGKRVLGVLIPAVEEAARITKNKRVGVIATQSTVDSQAFVEEIAKIDPKIKVFQQACPLLVPLVEEGAHKTEAARLILNQYLQPLKTRRVDTVILGCTHYGLMQKEIRQILGPEISIVWEAKVVPDKLADYLTRHPELEKVLGKNSQRLFYSTDLTDKFQKLGSKFFGAPIKVKKAPLKGA